MNKVVEYIIGAKDATGNAIKSALNRLKSFAASVGSNLQNIRAGIGMLRTAVSQAMSFMQKAFAFEKMTVQFKTLIGSMDEARAHMRMLQEMGDTPPFSLEEFAAASRQMMIMSDGALGFKKSLELVGDAAAATGQPIQNLAHEIGRAYAIIRDGQPLTRATMGLRNMGAITPEVAAKLDELQKSGASVTQIWETLTAELGKFKGAMAETERTGDGLVGAIKSQWDDAVREFGAALLETSKDCLSALLDKMKELREDGSIEVWANNTVEALNTVKEAASAVGTALGWIWDKTGASDVWNVGKGTLQSTGYFITRFAAGAFGEESISQAFEAANRERGDVFAKNVARGHWLGKMAERGWLGSGMKWASDDNKRDDEHEAQKNEEIRARARKRRKEREQQEREAAAKAEEEEARIQKQLADAQAKIDKKNAEAKAKAEAEAAKKAAEEEEKARLALEREIAKERERLWRADLKAQEAEYRRAQSEEAEAKSRLQEATAKESQAWGWYRDRDSWAAQLQEERAEAEAQKQFDKDFDRLRRFRSDWRTSDRLSDEDELIRRVALAREEKAAAEEYAKVTAEATQRAADALDAIQQAMEEGGEA